MTITSSTSSVVGNGNGATTVWPYSFLIPFLDDGITPAVIVSLVNTSTSVVTVLASNQYVISGVGNPAGGTVTYTPAIAPGVNIVIERNVPYTQTTSVLNQGFYPKTVESIADILEMQIQQGTGNFARAIRAPSSDGAVNMILPVKTLRALKLPAFNSGGDVIVSNLTLAYIEAACALANTLAAGTTAVAMVYLQVAAYRIPADPPTDDGPALGRCATAAAALGYRVAIPATGLRIESQVVLPNNTWLDGGGRNCVITGAIGQFLIATSISRLILSNFALTVTNNAYYPDFRAVDQLIVENVSSTAFVDGTTGLTAFGLRIRGCVNVMIDNCRFTNSNDAIYLEDYTGAKCGTVIITRSRFEHTLHGNFFSYPAQIYQFNCDHLFADDCDFVDIFPGNLGNPSPIGYAVYEGDGAGITTKVTNCRYKTTEARTDTAFHLNNTAKRIENIGNIVTAENAAGGGYLYRNGAGADVILIADNEADGWDIIIAESADAGVVVVRNNMIKRGNGNFTVIRFGVNAHKVAIAKAIGNVISAAQYGGIMFNGADWFEAQDNIINDVNKSNTAYNPGVNEFQVSAISVFGPILGSISRNRGGNTSAGGHAKYGVGIVTVAASHCIRVAFDNNFDRMETKQTLNGFNAANPPGTFPFFSKGERVANTEPAAATTPGWACVSSVRTTLSGNFVAGNTALAVVSSTGMLAGDNIAVLQDNGSYKVTTITAVPDGTHVTIGGGGLASAASTGNEVRSNLFKAEAAVAA